MIIVTLEKRGLQIRVQIRDTSTVRPAVSFRLVDATLFAAFVADWKTLYQRSEALISAKQPAALAEVEDKVRRKGKALTSLVFAQDAPDLGRGPLLFSFDPSLSDIPFEIMHLQNSFVCDRMPVLREVISPRGREEHHADRKASMRAVLLFDGSFSPEIAASVDREKRELLSQFKSRGELNVKIITTMPTPTTLLEELGEAKYVHFSGHHENGGNHVPYLTPETLNGADLRAVDAVFINACHSANTSDSTLTLAEAMIQGGVKNFVGFGLPVETLRAEDIAASFWKKVLAGIPVPEAVQGLRLELRERYGTGRLEWASLQHFGTSREKKSSWRVVAAATAGALVISMLLLGVALFWPPEDPAPVVIVTPSPAAREVKAEQPPVARHPAAPAPEKETAAPIPLAEETTSAALRAILESYPDLSRDNRLRELVISFYSERHPVYNEGRKIEIIRETMDLDVSPSMKAVKLRSEMNRK